jgi:hypothetical protein
LSYAWCWWCYFYAMLCYALLFVGFVVVFDGTFVVDQCSLQPHEFIGRSYVWRLEDGSCTGP